MLTLARVLAALAAVLHVYIWVLESLRWTDPKTRAVFGTDEHTADVTRPLAYNQGFYNLFLAIVAAVGAAAIGAHRAVGTALIVAGAGSMVAAALVLVTADRTKLRAATVQGVLPALSLLALLIAA